MMRPRFTKFLHHFGNLIPQHLLYEIRPAFDMLGLENTRKETLIVFDVGANRGLWTAALVHYAGPFLHQVHMFEPMPGNYDTIKQYLADGLYEDFVSKLIINKLAVGIENGSLTMRYDNEVTPYASAAVSIVQFRDHAFNLPKTIDVEVENLDSYCRRNNIEKIDLLKIDVEGFELSVLKGASSILSEKRVRCVLFEFGTHQLAGKEYFKDFWDFFEDHGYQMYHLQTLGRAPTKIEEYRILYENFSQMTMFLAIADE